MIIHRSIFKAKKDVSEKEINDLNKLLRLTPKLISHPDNKLLVPKLIDYCKSMGVEVIMDLNHISFSYFAIDINGNKSIHISKNPLACIFAHEVGHATATLEDSPNKGKRSMKWYPISMLLTGLFSWVNLFLSYYIGRNSKSPLKTIGTLGVTAFLLPYVLWKPVLTQENYATQTGLKLMEDFGASKEYLAMSKASLKAAYATYQSAVREQFVLNTGSAGLGVGTKLINQKSRISK